MDLVSVFFCFFVVLSVKMVKAYGKIDYEEAEAKIQFAKAVKSGGL